MFKRIAEWLTGRKRSDNVHPLDYVEARREREEAKKEQEPTKPESNNNIVWVAGDPATSAPALEPILVKEEKPTTQENGPWPFPVSQPEIVQEESKPKKPRKPRTKKV